MAEVTPRLDCDQCHAIGARGLCLRKPAYWIYEGFTLCDYHNARAVDGLPIKLGEVLTEEDRHG